MIGNELWCDCWPDQHWIESSSSMSFEVSAWPHRTVCSVKAISYDYIKICPIRSTRFYRFISDWLAPISPDIEIRILMKRTKSEIGASPINTYTKLTDCLSAGLHDTLKTRFQDIRGKTRKQCLHKTTLILFLFLAKYYTSISLSYHFCL